MLRTDSFDLAEDAPEALLRSGRAGYYAIISYFDDKLGRLLDCLEETGQRENTIVVYVSDHGEMAGEHGMWRKSNMYEASARVPLQISWPAQPSLVQPGRRCAAVTSTVDLIATLLELCNIDGEGLPPLDGHSLAPLMLPDAPADPTAAGWKDEALCEYLAHGVISPNAMLRVGKYKLMYSHGDQPALFDVVDDPDELHDLAQDPQHAETLAKLSKRLVEVWGEPAEIERQVRASQVARQCIADAAAGGSAGRRGRGGAARL